MSTYAKLDEEILKTIEAHNNPLTDENINAEAKRIAEASKREAFRVIDARLQALRKSGRIQYLKKAQSNGKAGWYIVKV